jgi:hypothetical protein
MARQTSYAAHAKRVERDAARRRKELAAFLRTQAVLAEQQRAQHKVNVYENQLEFLGSMHKDCGPIWDWRMVASRQPPTPPQPTHAREQEAALHLQAYRPSFFEKLFGGEKKRRAELSRSMEHARHYDAQVFATAQAEYAADVEMHRWEQRMAAAVLAGDLGAYRAAVDHLSPFAELSESGMRVTLDELRHDVVVLRCAVADKTVVPTEEKKLTQGGKLGTKKIPAGTYWALYQDFVCGCALRAAREIFSIVPVPRAVVNVVVEALDPSTGHARANTILAVSMPRETTYGLNFNALDPSDSLKHFPHRMKFKKTSGLEPVEPMSANESFVTTMTARAR